MKKYFSRYSYDFVKFALNQIAISIFGFALALTAVKMQNRILMLICSLGAIVFYLCLTYDTAWKVGYADRSAVRREDVKYSPLRGAAVSLCANCINIILAVIITVEALAFEPGATLARGIALLIQGMYQGLLAYIKIGDRALNEYWWAYFLIIIPAVLASTLGYLLGYKDIHIAKAASPQYPASDRPTKSELKERKKQDK